MFSLNLVCSCHFYMFFFLSLSRSLNSRIFFSFNEVNYIPFYHSRKKRIFFSTTKTTTEPEKKLCKWIQFLSLSLSISYLTNISFCFERYTKKKQRQTKELIIILIRTIIIDWKWFGKFSFFMCFKVKKISYNHHHHYSFYSFQSDCFFFSHKHGLVCLEHSKKKNELNCFHVYEFCT